MKTTRRTFLASFAALFAGVPFLRGSKQAPVSAVMVPDPFPMRYMDPLGNEPVPYGHIHYDQAPYEECFVMHELPPIEHRGSRWFSNP